MTGRNARRLFVLAAAVIGALVGAALAVVSGTSNADVRTAADNLVPLGSEITNRESGYQGDFPTRGPYFASVDYLSDDDHTARVRSAQAAAQEQNWRVVDTDDLPGAVVLRLERSDLSASIHVTRQVAPEFTTGALASGTARVERNSGTSRIVLGVVGGAGLSVLLALLFVRLRGPGPVTGSRPVPRSTGLAVLALVLVSVLLGCGDDDPTAESTTAPAGDASSSTRPPLVSTSTTPPPDDVVETLACDNAVPVEVPPLSPPATTPRGELLTARDGVARADESISIPVAFEGSHEASLAVFSSNELADLTVSFGDIHLEPSELLGETVLAADLSEPDDGELIVINSGPEEATVTVLVSIVTTRQIDVLAPESSTLGAPIPISVRVSESTAQDQPCAAVSNEGTGEELLLRLKVTDAPGTWSTAFTPAAAGSYSVVAVVDGQRSRVSSPALVVVE